MMNDDILKYQKILLYKYIKSGNELYVDRYTHSIGVMFTCMDLALKYGYPDLQKAMLCGLLHDYAKFETKDKYEHLITKYGCDSADHLKYSSLVHGLYGYLLIKDELAIDDEELLNAIKYHTTGCKNMSLLSKIVFVADFIEPGRKGPFFEEVRSAANISIDKAVALEAKKTFEHLKAQNYEICNYTIECYEYYKQYLEE